MKQMLIFIISVTMLLFQCSERKPSFKNGAKLIDHTKWDHLLNKYVDSNGLVDYVGFIKDSVQLNVYLNNLKENPPDIHTSETEKIAYWINVYNAFTIKLIIKYYPVKSIKDIGSTIQIPLINTPWDIKFIQIQDKKLDLNTIEHSILRKEFNEPRIHFAINCASMSCPRLRREAYIGEKLNGQLEQQAIDFINDSSQNHIEKNQAELSKIFSWFKSDFTKNGSLLNFINNYSSIQIDRDAKISFKDYDWLLNDQK